MILQALNRYYEILAADPESGVAPLGYSAAGVSFALNVSEQGELLDIFPLFDQVERGKKTVEVPRRLIVPEQVKRTAGVLSNFLCDNSAYVLGISSKAAEDPSYALKRFEAFCRYNQELLGKVDCLEAKAVICFLERYDPQHGRDHPVIAARLEDLMKGGNLVFMFNGTSFVQDQPDIRRVWEIYKAGGDAKLGQCLVTGETAPIARLHPSLKGIMDANPTGATLVGFNARAYESYNWVGGQGLNSPVSEKATFAYSTALNDLLSKNNPNKKFTVGDTTVVYWAESADKAYGALFAGLFAPDGDQPAPQAEDGVERRDRTAEERLKAIAARVRQAQAVDTDSLLEGLDPETKFYVLGLAPNAARISVRFFHMDPFRKIVETINAHYSDLAIIKEFENQPTRIPLWQILSETVSKKASDSKASPLMAGALFRAILNAGPYPAALYYAIINRIRADMDDKQVKKINYVRAAVIKAFLIRKYRNQPKFQEVLVMALNEQAAIPAYVLGRLFAVLEKVQQEAIGDVNASIKDRYFTSACASPSSVFPVLLRLSQHHIAKAEYGYSSDRRIQDILNLLDVEKNPIPSHLTLDEQGVFVLGYYHQRAAFYTPKNHQPIEITGSETH